MKLTKNDAQEVLHKLGVLADEPDLQADYGLTKEQAVQLRQSVPANGGEWSVPDWAIEAVKGEMQDHAVVLRACAKGAHRHNKTGQALGISKQAKRLEKIFE